MMLWVALAWSAPVDLNHADLEQLDLLPGLGRAKAVAIVRHREAHGAFQTWADVERVSGLGPATLAALKRYARLRADLESLDLPVRGDREAPLPLTPSAAPLNPNTAAVDELMTWPGIDRERAQAIVTERATAPFATCADLMRVPAFGPSTISVVEPYCDVSADP